MAAREVTLSLVVRRILGLATIVFVIAALTLGEGRLFVAAAALGTMWWAWDFLVDFVFEPLEDFAHHLLSGGAATDRAEMRPSLDDTIRLLESHLAHPTSAKVDINAAIRLEEIYRTVKKDSARARTVIRTVRERYPNAPELRRFGDDDDEESLLEKL